MIAGLEQRTREAFPDWPDATHLDYVEAWQASGKTLNKLADELSQPDALGSSDEPSDQTAAPTESSPTPTALANPLPVSGEMISRYLDKTFGADEVRQRLTRARARGAHRLNDEALAIADADDSDAQDRLELMVHSIQGAEERDKDRVLQALTSSAIQRDRLRIAARQWTAEKWNVAEFGPSRGVNVAISVTQLHLAALQQYNTTVTGAAEIEELGAHNTKSIPNGNGQVVVTLPLAES